MPINILSNASKVIKPKGDGAVPFSIVERKTHLDPVLKSYDLAGDVLFGIYSPAKTRHEASVGLNGDIVTEGLFVKAEDTDQARIDNYVDINSTGAAYAWTDITVGAINKFPLKHTLIIGDQNLGADVKSVVGFSGSSLAFAADAACLALTDTVTPNEETTEVFYNTFNPAEYVPGEQPCFPSAVRNPACFIPQNLLTGISIAGNYLESNHSGAFGVNSSRPGTLISPRHCIGARHYHGKVGDTYIFMREDGTTIEAEVIDRIDVNTALGMTQADLCVSYLDKDITGCRIYKMMPEGWEDAHAPSLKEYLNNSSVNTTDPWGNHDIPHIRYTRHGIQDIANDKGGTIHISSIAKYTSVTTPTYRTEYYYIKQSELRNYKDFTHPGGALEGGDSGCPQFIALDLGSGIEFFYIGSGYNVAGITNASAYVSTLNTMLNDMATAQNTAGQTNPDATAGSYQIGVPDLSAVFTDYSL